MPKMAAATAVRIESKKRGISVMMMSRFKLSFIRGKMRITKSHLGRGRKMIRIGGCLDVSMYWDFPLNS
jgi:hypothetical protein